jgi:hypothetical protein
VLVGKDPLTGEKLSSFERALAGAFIAGAILTVGVSNTLKLEAKAVKAIAKATENEARLAEKLTKVIAKSPLKVEVLVKGTSENFTIIGRDMTRLSEVGTALKSEGISVNTLDNFSDAANEQWDRLIESQGGGRLSNAVVKTTIKYAENQKWIRDALEKGHTIIDLGNPLSKDFSPFYEMEKGEILEFLRRIGK